MTIVPDWNGTLDPIEPDNYWIDEATGERVHAATGARTPPCEFVQEQPHEWRCTSHDCLMIGSQQAPVFCAVIAALIVK